MKPIAMIAALSVAGCAAPIHIGEARSIAARSADWELCYVAISGKGQQSIRQAASEEIAARRTNCNDHAAAVQARLNVDAQRSAAMGQAGAALMNAGRPQPSSLRQPVHCRSVVVGGGVTTVCD